MSANINQQTEPTDRDLYDEELVPNHPENHHELQDEATHPEQHSLDRAEEPPLVLINIHQYNPHEYQLINSPRTLQAMIDLQITRDDLRLKGRKDYRGMFGAGEEENLEYWLDLEEKRYQGLVESISKRRDRIIAEEEREKLKKLEHEERIRAEKRRLQEEKDQLMYEVQHYEERRKNGFLPESVKRGKPTPKKPPIKKAHQTLQNLLENGLTDRTMKDIKIQKEFMKASLKEKQKEIIELSSKKNNLITKSYDQVARKEVRIPSAIDEIKQKQMKDLESVIGFEMTLMSIKNIRDKRLEVKREVMQGEQKYKELNYDYNKKIVEREKQLRDLEKKLDEMNKLYTVARTKKANEVLKAQQVAKFEYTDTKARNRKAYMKDALESRKLMMQKLKKDLGEMKAGLISPKQLEKKYQYVHDEDLFEKEMSNLQKEIHPEQSIKAGIGKNSRFRINKAEKSTEHLRGSYHGLQDVRNPSALRMKDHISNDHSYLDPSFDADFEYDIQAKPKVRPQGSHPQSAAPAALLSSKQGKEHHDESRFKDLKKQQDKEMLEAITEQQRKNQSSKAKLDSVSDPLEKAKLELAQDQEQRETKQKIKSMVKRHAEELAKIKRKEV